MGSPLSPLLTDLYMHTLLSEKKVITIVLKNFWLITEELFKLSQQLRFKN